MWISKITPAVYKMLVAARHPESVGLERQGIRYEHYRSLRKPWLLEMNIRTVLDIGANTGQFARLIHAALPEAAIISFEPLPDCYEILRQALPAESGFQALNCAIGDQDGELEFFRSAHSPSSSFLTMTEFHKEAFPESAGGQESRPLRVPVRKLDDITRNLSLQDNLLVKMDVQGYEDKVIAGGAAILKRTKVVIVEMSFLPLYQGQPLFDDIYRKLVDLGFTFQGNIQQAFHPVDGRIVSADSVFIRAEE